MHQCSRGEKRINDRQGPAVPLGFSRYLPPPLGDGGIDGEHPARETAGQILVHPAFYISPPR